MAQGYYFNWDISTDSESGVSHYKLYKDNVYQVGEDVNHPTGFKYLGTTAPTECWSVSAVDNAGNESAKATCVSYIPPDTTKPTTPSFTTLTALFGENYLQWSPSTDNVGVTGYYIYRGTISNSSTHLFVGSTLGATAYFDTSYTPNVVQYYHIRAIDAAGNLSNASIVKSVTNITIPE